ncbi:MAG TPA: cytidine deaminase [Clostridia bacterium]|nr:cytidine deaminase [Clostridia bacterium]
MIQIHDFEIKSMLRMANDAKERAYVPYSKFRVGACLKTASGAYYLGCNIENAAYSPTNCAERTAIFKAVYDGERKFEAIAIVWDGEGFASPCGVCRQVLAEFCEPDMPVICADRSGQYRVVPFGELLPAAFTPADLNV